MRRRLGKVRTIILVATAVCSHPATSELRLYVPGLMKDHLEDVMTNDLAQWITTSGIESICYDVYGLIRA